MNHKGTNTQGFVLHISYCKSYDTWYNYVKAYFWEDAMKYNIHVTENDYVKMNVYQMQNSKIGKRTKALLNVSVLLLSLAFIVFCFANADETLSLAVPIIESVIVVAVLLVFVTVLSPKFLKQSVKLAIKSAKADGKLPYSPELVIEFTDTMIIEHTDTTDTRLMYKDIEKICQTEDALYIFIDSSRAFLIPYADLGSDTQKVIDFVKEKQNG